MDYPGKEGDKRLFIMNLTLMTDEWTLSSETFS